MKHELSTDVEGDGTTAKLCKWITRLDESQIPPSVLERAKYLILDGVGCGLVGAHVPWSQQCADAMKEFEPHGKCAVIGYDEVWRAFRKSIQSRIHSSLISQCRVLSVMDLKLLRCSMGLSFKPPNSTTIIA